MKKIGELTLEVIRKFELGKYQKRINALTYWNEVAGKELSKLARPVGFNKSIMILEILHPAAAMEIRLRKDELINEINSISEEDLFTDLKTVLPGKNGRQRYFD